MVEQHADHKPVIVFCATRKDTVKCAKEIATSSAAVGHTFRKRSDKVTTPLKDKDLTELVAVGIAFHHAGLDMNDRNAVEKLFLSGGISVIVATSTLAVGVNLPAHLVILKNTLTYTNGSFEEYSDLEVLQMSRASN